MLITSSHNYIPAHFALDNVYSIECISELIFQKVAIEISVFVKVFSLFSFWHRLI